MDAADKGETGAVDIEPVAPTGDAAASAALAEIAANLGVLSSAMHDLVVISTGDMQHQIKRQSQRTRLAIGVVTVLVLGLLWLSVSNRQLATDRAHTADQSARTADQIADCTTPGGVCYQRTQDQLAAALAQLTAAEDARAKKTVNQAVCAVRPDLCDNGVPQPGVIPEG